MYGFFVVLLTQQQGMTRHYIGEYLIHRQKGQLRVTRKQKCIRSSSRLSLSLSTNPLDPLSAYPLVHTASTHHGKNFRPLCPTAASDVIGLTSSASETSGCDTSPILLCPVPARDPVPKTMRWCAECLRQPPWPPRSLSCPGNMFLAQSNKK